MTNQSILRDRTLAFRSLHVPGSPLVLPNAWDTASARIVEDAGAAAVATTSAGLAWALGAADGDTLDRDRALAAVADIAAAVDVPVSADVETGYAKDPAEVADTIRAVLAAGVVGVNIEDALYEGDRGPLRPVAEQASEARWGSPGRSLGEDRRRPRGRRRGGRAAVRQRPHRHVPVRRRGSRPHPGARRRLPRRGRRRDLRPRGRRAGDRETARRRRGRTAERDGRSRRPAGRGAGRARRWGSLPLERSREWGSA